MNELLKALPSLLGVVVGGLITFLIQQVTLRKQQNWDRKKLELDKFYKDEDRKFQAYNKILQMDGTYRIHTIDHHTGDGELDEKNYNEYIRPILFDIFHLLDENIAKQVNRIEEIYERQYAMEEANPDDDEKLSKHYLTILQLIKHEFNELRKLKEKIKRYEL